MPDVAKAAVDCEKFGAEGITVHPRPDQRHIRYSDVREIRPLITTEFNIEGNPIPSFVDLVLEVVPDQVTLVPDAHDAITSNAGWDTVANRDFLTDICKEFKSKGIRTSIFIDPDPEMAEGAAICGSDRVELYTADYALYYPVNPEKAIADYHKTAKVVKECGLGLNAGHDLNLENLEFFFGYQMHHMYWRYFMWNFAGRQNDIASNGPGDVARGNWISGIPFLDKARLHNLEYVPDEFGSANKGHNVFFMLPLLLGLIGLLWQAFSGKKGIEQFWVVFFLFFMTGIAIVMYLNQTPSQPRERDYAYAGSFYAYAIWIGMGVAGLWKIAMSLIGEKKKATKVGTASVDEPEYSSNSLGTVFAAIVALIGLAVPLQMVSQTWDDHDRSGRYCARDFGENYLQSLDKDAIIFCNGDNDTFPLWYLQEVEGVRTDVRAVNLSYLATDWYIAQMQRAAYDSKPLPMYASPTTYAYDKRQGGSIATMLQRTRMATMCSATLR